MNSKNAAPVRDFKAAILQKAKETGAGLIEITPGSRILLHSHAPHSHAVLLREPLLLACCTGNVVVLCETTEVV
jgi:quercetin dioxygenase-like cupin family protein